MDFEKICMIFTMQEPFYGILLSSMQRLPTKKIDTMGVTRSGGVFKLYYNPDFVAPLTVDQTLLLIKHEILHLAFNHFSLWDNRANEDIEHLRNISADMEVNSYLDEAAIQDLKGVTASMKGWEKCLGTKEYFKRLMDEAQQRQQQAQANKPQQPCNGGQGGQQPDDELSDDGQQQTPQSGSPEMKQGQEQDGGTPSSQMPMNGGFGQTVPQEMLDELKQMDDHSMWPQYDNKEEEQLVKDEINSLLDFAAQEVEKSCGNVPGEMKGRIEQIRKKPRPVTDWKRYFRRYLGNEFTDQIRKSKKRESKRFPDAAGNRHRRKSHILVAIDTSGSVSMPEYKEFMGQIRTLYDTATFHVLECDSSIQHEYDFKNRIPEELHGGGGTSFYPVTDYFHEHRKLYDALVYFTDGYSDIPKNTPKETLWVISSQGKQQRERYKVNGASVVFIPKKN